MPAYRMPFERIRKRYHRVQVNDLTVNLGPNLDFVHLHLLFSNSKIFMTKDIFLHLKWSLIFFFFYKISVVLIDIQVEYRQTTTIVLNVEH